jgi:hypothetical protein
MLFAVSIPWRGGAVTKKRKKPLLENPVADIANILDSLTIPYVLTGSFAFAAHKKMPLGTKDVDVVVYAPSRVRLAELLNRLRDAGVPLDAASALRSLDKDKLVSVPMPLAGRPGEHFTFPVELVLPKVPAIDRAILERAVDMPYPDRPQGVKVVTLEDYVLFKIVFFRERDRNAIDEVLRTTPDLDVGYVAISLGLVHSPETERARWFAEACRRHGFVKNPRPDRPAPMRRRSK